MKVALDDLLGGGLNEQFSKAFERVIDNLHDPNTPFKVKRKINITLTFTQNEARDDVSCDLTVSEKLAAQTPMKTAFIVGKNLKTGEIYAEEYGRHNHLKGQTSIDDIAVDPKTGEVIEENTKPVVLDLRQAATN